MKRPSLLELLAIIASCGGLHVVQKVVRDNKRGLDTFPRLM